MMGLSGRFFGRMGASRIDRNICGPTVGAGMRMTNGSGRAMDALELEHSKLILLWGTNTKLTNRHLWPTIEKARANGARIVVIDPIRTLTAEAIDVDRGDQFIQPLPGTDIAMMLAMMHVIIRDGLTNDDMDRRAHARLRRAARGGRRLDPGTGRARSPGSTPTSIELARHRLRDDPTGRDPHDHRRRAPRERRDVLPHARLPARADRCLGRTRRRHRQERRVVQRRPHRRAGVHPTRPRGAARAAASRAR